MLLRPAMLSDVPAMLAIYNREVLTSTATMDTEPIPPERYVTWFESHPAGRYPALVAVEPSRGTIAGWTCASQWSPRKAYLRTAEDSVYVHESFRGQGLGVQLLTALQQTTYDLGIRTLIARIEESREASQRLHARVGFQRAGVLRRVSEKFGRVLDVGLWECHLDGANGA